MRPGSNEPNYGLITGPGLIVKEKTVFPFYTNLAFDNYYTLKTCEITPFKILKVKTLITANFKA